MCTEEGMILERRRRWVNASAEKVYSIITQMGGERGAEQQLIRALFKMAKAAENKQLEAGFSGASGTDQRACRSSRKVLS